MSFKYINPGYLYLMNTDCIGVQYNDTVKNPINGVSFMQTNKESVISLTAGLEYWAKFDVYLNQSDLSGNIFTFSSANHNIAINISGSSSSSKVSMTLLVDGTNVSTVSINAGYNTIYIHALSGTTTGSVNIINLSNSATITYDNTVNNGNIFNGENIVSSCIYSIDEQNAFFSNIIIANSLIDQKECVIIYPIKQTTTSWYSNNDGSYKTANNNSTLLKQIDLPATQSTIGCSFPKLEELCITSKNLHADSSSFDGITTIAQNNGTNYDLDNNTLTNNGLNYLLTMNDNIFNSNTSWQLKDINKILFGFRANTVAGTNSYPTTNGNTISTNTKDNFKEIIIS